MWQKQITADKRLIPGPLVLKERQLRLWLLQASGCVHAIRLIYLGVDVQQERIRIRQRPLHVQTIHMLSTPPNDVVLAAHASIGAHVARKESFTWSKALIDYHDCALAAR